MSNINKPRKWTKESVIASLHAAHEQGVHMNASGICGYNSRLYEATRREFGSTQKAVEAAGLKYERKKAQWYPRKPIVLEPLPEPEQREILPVTEEFKAKYRSGKRPMCGWF